MADASSLIGQSLEGATILSPQEGPQTWLLACPYDEILFGGARGGGKSLGIILCCHAHGLRWKSYARMIIFRRTLKEFEGFLGDAKAFLPPLGWEFKVGAMKFEHPNGAVIKLAYLAEDKDADGYQGSNFSLVCIDEIGNFSSMEPINKIKACLRSAHGVKTQFIASANPGGPLHKALKQRYLDPAPGGLVMHRDPVTKRSLYFIPSKLEDNKFLMEADPHYADSLLGTGPPWLLKAWRDGDWSITIDGNVFKREWWKWYGPSYEPCPNHFDQIIQSWDTAFKTKTRNDYSACVTIGVTKNAYYILNAWKGKMEFPELKKKVKELANAYGPHVVYIEDQSSGQSLIQELKRDSTLCIRPCKTDVDKIARAYAVSPMVENGMVYLPEADQWIHEFTEELSAFPVMDGVKVKHDDMVDAFTQALDKLAHRGQGLNIDFKKNVRNALRGLSIFQR